VKLIVQPDAGIVPILSAIQRAKKTIQIVIFRFAMKDLEDELEKAVKRRVIVTALIAHTNSGGDKRLRKLEMRMLERGVTVNRTEDDLVRYHGKVLIVDGRRAYILGFNYTKADLKSRSFGVMTESPRVVKELLRLFDADANRTEYVPRMRDLVVSPENARRRLESFIRKARTRIDIYDPQVSDDRMLELLRRRATKGVEVRILGTLEAKWAKAGFDARPFPGGRLHVRAMIRDGRRAFVGSQSLRKLELDNRREVGLIVRDSNTVRKLQKIFERDWKQTEPTAEKAVMASGRATERRATP
jgi:phosphatidylserine/phosphatidylglycerophosphate/cardiolipin synthase-like enzyme